MSTHPSPNPQPTQDQGSLQDRYEIYRANADSLGWQVKTFEEWLHS